MNKRKALWGMILLLLVLGSSQLSRAEPGQEEKNNEKGRAQCSTTMPIQIMGETKRNPVTTLSAARISVMNSNPSSRFYAFVADVTEHVEARLAKDKLCITSAKTTDDMVSAYGEQRSLLQFVHWPLSMARESSIPVLIIAHPPSSGVCRMSSPWIDLTIERSPVLQIRGVVRWNERQQLADLAVLAGVQNVPSGVAMPLTSLEFGRFVHEYEDSVIRGKPAAKPIEKRIPPDILWLFRRSSQSPTKYGGFGGDMDKIIEKGGKGYTKLVIALIDRCLAFEEADFDYSGGAIGSNLYSSEKKVKTPAFQAGSILLAADLYWRSWNTAKAATPSIRSNIILFG